MPVQRVSYSVYVNSPKTYGQKPNTQDLVNVGYMAGRYGINLDGNPNENNQPKFTDKGVLINVNSCTTDALETNLKQSGIKFDRMA